MLPVGVDAAAERVAVLHRVAVAGGDRCPKASVLAEREHLGAVLAGDLGRAVGRAVVDDEDVGLGSSPRSSSRTAGRFSSSFQAGMKTSVSRVALTRKGYSQLPAGHVAELVGVEDRPHGDDHALGDLEPSHPTRVSARVVEDNARIARRSSSRRRQAGSEPARSLRRTCRARRCPRRALPGPCARGRGPSSAGPGRRARGTFEIVARSRCLLERRSPAPTGAAFVAPT